MEAAFTEAGLAAMVGAMMVFLFALVVMVVAIAEYRKAAAWEARYLPRTRRGGR